MDAHALPLLSRRHCVVVSAPGAKTNGLTGVQRDLANQAPQFVRNQAPRGRYERTIHSTPHDSADAKAKIRRPQVTTPSYLAPSSGPMAVGGSGPETGVTSARAAEEGESTRATHNAAPPGVLTITCMICT